MKSAGRSEGDAVSHTADPVLSATPRATLERSVEHLLCIDGDRSFTVPIPATGELVIGRGPEAGLSIEDPLVSRAHVQLMVVPDGLRLSDLGSRHGTLVNGERITEPRLLASGDVITIGNTLLVVRRPLRASRARNVTERPVLVRRLTEELARAAQYERQLALLVVKAVERDDPAELLAAIADRLRVIDSVAPIGRHLGVLLPELGAADAIGFARTLANAGAGKLSIGYAIAPFDGTDADTLLGAARTACDQAEPGDVAAARTAAETITAGPQRILVADPGMARLYELARRLARSSIPILILGETGVGKELAAAAIHAFSARATAPFVSVNCAAIPETLAESELFGHTKGAFSGALAAKLGYLEAASGGTLFLDEIGELTLAIQAKLLRVLESGELLRVGEVKPKLIDLRIVAATNRDLQQEVDAGRFRGDLYFRLGAARLEIPPLRDRGRDIALLSARMLEDACRKLGRAPLELGIATGFALFRHDWPGNIRELRHVIEYASAAAPETASEIEIWHLPKQLADAARRARDAESDAEPDAPPVRDAPAPDATTPSPGSFRPIADEVRELERARMIAALRATAGVQNKAADLIEMPLRTFVTKLKRYAIVAADWGGT